jgi:serine/threonine protein kinase
MEFSCPTAWSVDDFHLDAKLGEGRFSTVYLAREKRTGYKVAVKVLEKESLHAAGMQHQVEREARLHRYASRHQNVLRQLAMFWDSERIYFVTELADGGPMSVANLKRRLGSALPGIPEGMAATWAAQLLSAVAFCHERGIAHRDIKPDNLLLRKGTLKLADFTWSTTVTEDQSRNTFCGTLDYLPPEVLQLQPHDLAVDIWSVGTVVYEWLAGKPPFDAADPAQICGRITSHAFDAPETASPSAMEFFRAALAPHDQRPTAQALLRHDWITQHAR